MERSGRPSLDCLHYERGFGGSIGFGSKPALIVVDMQVGFTDPASPLGSNQDSQIAEISKLLDLFRRHRLPVVFFTAIRYEEPDCADAGVWRFKNAGVVSMASGRPDVELNRRVAHQHGEPIVYRAYPSGFFGTDLSTRLRTRAVDSVVVVGCTTSGCVRATIVDALSYGFRPIVATAAVYYRSKEAHEQSLIDMEAKYADVLETSEIVSLVDAVAVGGSQKEDRT